MNSQSSGDNDLCWNIVRSRSAAEHCRDVFSSPSMTPDSCLMRANNCFTLPFSRDVVFIESWDKRWTKILLSAKDAVLVQASEIEDGEVKVHGALSCIPSFWFSHDVLWHFKLKLSVWFEPGACWSLPAHLSCSDPWECHRGEERPSCRPVVLVELAWANTISQILKVNSLRDWWYGVPFDLTEKKKKKKKKKKNW